jgi:hypothetical protein
MVDIKPKSMGRNFYLDEVRHLSESDWQPLINWSGRDKGHG